MNEPAPYLLIFGFGYCGRAIATLARDAGFGVIATSRNPAGLSMETGIDLIDFAGAARAIGKATHILASAAPGGDGDPVLALYAAEIAAAPRLQWLGYLSTTGVYGDRDGGWVDENTQPMAQSARGQRRIAAESAWGKFSDLRAVDIFRLAGIYGSGRSMFDDLREGNARHVVKRGHLFGRIHRDDIAAGVLAAMQQNLMSGLRIFNFTDDEPAASADVVCEAASLLGFAPPLAMPFDQAVVEMSPMARSFWADNRKVSSAKTKLALGINWKYPSYREGLRAILAEESHQSLG